MAGIYFAQSARCQTEGVLPSSHPVECGRHCHLGSREVANPCVAQRNINTQTPALGHAMATRPLSFLLSSAYMRPSQT